MTVSVEEVGADCEGQNSVVGGGNVCCGGEGSLR